MRARSAAGAGPASDPATATPLFVPQLSTARVAGATVTLVWETALDGTSTPPPTAFTVAVTDGGARLTPSGLTLAGATVTLTLATPLAAGAAATLDYSAPTGAGAMPLRDTAGNAAANLVQRPLVNVPGAPATLTASPGAAAVVLAWTAPARDGGAPVTGYEYRYKAADAAAFPAAWTDAGAALTATLDGLANGAAYNFEVRARNVAGNGAAAQRDATPRAPRARRSAWRRAPRPAPARCGWRGARRPPTAARR